MLSLPQSAQVRGLLHHTARGTERWRETGGGGGEQTDGPTDRDRQSVSDKCSPVCLGLTEKQTVCFKQVFTFFFFFFFAGGGGGGGGGFVPSHRLSSLAHLLKLTFCPVRED